mmetsp:Transcript_22892/g.52440  ORF Transcript_22892/g.52440 Transcript_22892/m.52440 type:complete len:662 (-) Transcript_22892:44-2029(-)
MDVVWLKRDVRLHDHAPFSEVLRSSNCFCILYLYEPDQLSEPSVHGSHVSFINEGLVDLDLQLTHSENAPTEPPTASEVARHTFRSLTVCRAGAVFTLETLRKRRGLRRILCHEETGHLRSYRRDRQVRRWCRRHGIALLEYVQSGATRRLADRDAFAARLDTFLEQTPCVALPTAFDRARLVTDLDLPGRRRHVLPPEELTEIPAEHRTDRCERQAGGERRALATLGTFLSERGAGYMPGISSPNVSWWTGSRLSPYLAWGHLSPRYVIHRCRERVQDMRKQQQSDIDRRWLRSLSAFSSRVHWRSHFIQKLESEPNMERQDLCSAYQHLRRGPDDWNATYYTAWSCGKTGFPFVDACMRCLLRHGWLNFRMRAMLVSFATYNLWLDWKRIAPHLARVFLDFEPGIHYPQLQMQAGTTGINAMRVYNVTKQGRDQDPRGLFIRKYVPELKNVPLEYIHEPHKMSLQLQQKLKIRIGEPKIISVLTTKVTAENEFAVKTFYPSPIVDEKETAKVAKDKVAMVRNLMSTKRIAQEVYIKHGSRNKRSNEMNGVKPKALSSSTKRIQLEDRGQTSIKQLFSSSRSCQKGVIDDKRDAETLTRAPHVEKKLSCSVSSPCKLSLEANIVGSAEGVVSLGSWSCKSCTFLNEKPMGLACSVCGAIR